MFFVAPLLCFCFFLTKTYKEKQSGGKCKYSTTNKESVCIYAYSTEKTSTTTSGQDTYRQLKIRARRNAARKAVRVGMCGLYMLVCRGGGRGRGSAGVSLAGVVVGIEL